MGRNSSGVRGSSQTNLAQSINDTERKLRVQSFESSAVFDDNGNIIHSKDGQKYSIQYSEDELKLFKDRVFTHNHPRALNRTGLASIGNSFSEADLTLAVHADLKEMRAITPRYKFSMKRPKGGWNATIEKVREVFKEETKKVSAEFQSYVWGAKNEKEEAERVERVQARHFNEINRRVAKRLGWIYTKQKG